MEEFVFSLFFLQYDSAVCREQSMSLGGYLAIDAGFFKCLMKDFVDEEIFKDENEKVPSRIFCAALEVAVC